MFKVQKIPCTSCIYRRDSPHDIEKLEQEIKDPHIGFKTYRICHHTDDVCCAGFWKRHKDDFPAGQVAQRLDLVEFVSEDDYPLKSTKKTIDNIEK